uniref:Uncharacterized protein n=1 Tax=Micrurus corallinus TaxID=54390 RepID=A0A2D4G8C6_MICCO
MWLGGTCDHVKADESFLSGQQSDPRTGAGSLTSNPCADTRIAQARTHVHTEPRLSFCPPPAKGQEKERMKRKGKERKSIKGAEGERGFGEQKASLYIQWSG